jgi:hypothetical protein
MSQILSDAQAAAGFQMIFDGRQVPPPSPLDWNTPAGMATLQQNLTESKNKAQGPGPLGKCSYTVRSSVTDTTFQVEDVTQAECENDLNGTFISDS